MSRFFKLALVGATSLSLAFTPVTASAGSNGEDLAKALAGLAVLGIVAKAIDDRKDRRKRRRAAKPNHGSIEQQPLPKIIDGEIRRPGDRLSYKDHPLPDRCLRVVDTAKGAQEVYAGQCLNRRYAYAHKLPQHCERLVRTYDGLRTVYASRCLASKGWLVAQY